MHTTTIEIPTDDGVADAFVAYPDDDRPHPGILFYMDVIGLRPAIHDMVGQLAAEGYYVLAPNLFYRNGRAPVIDIPDLTDQAARTGFMRRAKPMMDEHTAARSVIDADAYLGHLTLNPQVSSGPVGVVGYCMGAVLAMRTAASHPSAVAAAAGFHPGRLVTEAADSPHRLAAHIDAELLFGLAQRDDSMPPEAVEQLKSSLDAAAVTYDCEVYPDTVHGFTMSDTAAFSPSGRQRHWDRLLPFFARLLNR